MNYKKSLSTQLLIDEARDRRIQIRDLSRQQDFQLFSYRGHQEYLRWQITSNNSAVAYSASTNKRLTIELFKQAGLSVPRGRVFAAAELAAAEDFIKEIGWPIVIKPLSGTHGDDVYVNLNNLKEARAAFKKVLRRRPVFLVEQFFTGQEYRIFATREKFVSAINRVPANVVGDGRHSLKELIEIKNSDPRRGLGYEKALLQIKIDSEIRRVIAKQKLALNSVPASDKIIYLRQNSNISTGGDSYEVSHLVHPSVKKIAVQAIRAIPGLQYAGLDFLTKDITKSQTKKSYVLIELNSSPMISMHHFPYQGKPKNVAKEILDLLFPETKGKNKSK